MFKIGNYVFIPSPYAKNSKIEYVGANMITLSGKKIFQPSYYRHNIELSCIIWKPMPTFLYSLMIDGTFIACDNNNFYIWNNDSKILSKYNKNFINISQKNINILNFIDITCSDDYVFLLEKISAYNYKLYYLLKDLSGQVLYTNFTTNNLFEIKSITFQNGKLYFLATNNYIYEYDFLTGFWVQKTLLPVVAGGYITITSYLKDFVVVSSYWLEDFIIYFYDIYNFNLLDKEVFNYARLINSLCYCDNLGFVFVDISKKAIVTRKQSVNCEVWLLENELNKDKVLMIDEYGRNVQFVVENYSINRIKEFYDGVEINIQGFYIE